MGLCPLNHTLDTSFIKPFMVQCKKRKGVPRGRGEKHGKGQINLEAKNGPAPQRGHLSTVEKLQSPVNSHPYEMTQKPLHTKTYK